jgi:hypothetical protein
MLNNNNTSNWKSNIRVGSFIKLKNDQNIYILYGYNSSRTEISYFPIESMTIYGNTRNTEIDNIDSLEANHNNTNIGSEKENENNTFISYISSLFKKLKML